jgi:hypothetical protein
LVTVDDSQLIFFVSLDGGKTLRRLRPDTQVSVPFSTSSVERTVSKALSPGAKKGVLGSIVRLDGIPPDSASWTQLASLAARYTQVHVVAVVSPNNGAGQSVDADYLNGMRYLRANNVTVIGYVDTVAGKRSISDVRGEIGRWKQSFYQDAVDGIFFDGVACNEYGMESYYFEADDYAKNGMGMNFSVANTFGQISCLDSYVERTNINVFITYDGRGYPSIGSLKAGEWMQRERQDRFGIMAYAVSPIADEARNFLNLAVASERDRAVGYVYLQTEERWSAMGKDGIVRAPALSPLTELTLIELTRIKKAVL